LIVKDVVGSEGLKDKIVKGRHFEKFFWWFFWKFKDKVISFKMGN